MKPCSRRLFFLKTGIEFGVATPQQRSAERRISFKSLSIALKRSMWPGHPGPQPVRLRSIWISGTRMCHSCFQYGRADWWVRLDAPPLSPARTAGCRVWSSSAHGGLSRSSRCWRHVVAHSRHRRNCHRKLSAWRRSCDKPWRPARRPPSGLYPGERWR